MGENRIVLSWEAPAAIVPFVQLEVYPPGPVNPETVRGAFPLFAIRSTASNVLPTWTLPKSMVPLSAMIRVGVDVEGAAGEGEDLLPQAAMQTPRARTDRTLFMTPHERACVA
jgi:hypothetical protein